MILKIERYYGQKDWWILDDIRKVSKSTYRYSNSRDAVEFDYDIMILDFLDSRPKGNKEEFDCVVFVCRLSNGEEFSLIFDTIAYLCNDVGKTIEKVVANYNDK